MVVTESSCLCPAHALPGAQTEGTQSLLSRGNKTPSSFPVSLTASLYLASSNWPHGLNVMLTKGHGTHTASHGLVPTEQEKRSLRSGRKPFPAAGPAGSDSPEAAPTQFPALDTHTRWCGDRAGGRESRCVCVCALAWNAAVIVQSTRSSQPHRDEEGEAPLG